MGRCGKKPEVSAECAYHQRFRNEYKLILAANRQKIAKITNLESFWKKTIDKLHSARTRAMIEKIMNQFSGKI